MSLLPQAVKRSQPVTPASEKALAEEVVASVLALWAEVLARPWGRPMIRWGAGQLRLGPDSADAMDAAELAALDVDRVLLALVLKRAPAVDARLQAARQRAEDARQRMMSANLGLVCKHAMSYTALGLEYDELVHEGVLGLHTAVLRFEPARGLRFSTFASWWIRHAIGRAVSDKSRIVRMPQHRVDLHREMLRLRREMAGAGAPPTDQELAAAMGRDIRLIEELCGLASVAPMSLDVHVPCSDGAVPLLDIWIGDQDVRGELGDAETRLDIGRMLSAMAKVLSAKERDILVRHFGLEGQDQETMASIAESYGVTRERIRQLQSRALRKLRTRLEEVGAEA